MKALLRELLLERRFGEIADLAAQKKRVLGLLVSLTFDREPLIAWRAVEAIGLAAERVAETNPEYVRGHLRRLHWLLSDESGGICWYAPQAMAEIIRRRPHTFSDYVSVVVSLIVTMEEEDLTHFRAGILWAIGRLAPISPDEVESVLPAVAACLDGPDPQDRGMAVWCLLRAGQRSLIMQRAELLSDDGPIEIYENGRIERTTVRALLLT